MQIYLQFILRISGCRQIKISAQIHKMSVGKWMEMKPQSAMSCSPLLALILALLAPSFVPFNMWQCDNERWTEATKDNTACEISFRWPRNYHIPASNYFLRLEQKPIYIHCTKLLVSISIISCQSTDQTVRPLRTFQLLFKITANANITVNCYSQYFPNRLN